MKSFRDFVKNRISTEEPIKIDELSMGPLKTRPAYAAMEDDKLDPKGPAIHTGTDEERGYNPLTAASKELKNGADDMKDGSSSAKLGAGALDALNIALEDGKIEMSEFKGEVKQSISKILKALEADVLIEVIGSLDKDVKEQLHSELMGTLETDKEETPEEEVAPKTDDIEDYKE